MQEHLGCKAGAYTITHESKTNRQLKQLISEAAKNEYVHMQLIQNFNIEPLSFSYVVFIHSCCILK